MIFRADLGQLHTLNQHIGKVEAGVVQVHLAPLRARKIEQVVDQSLKLFALALDNLQAA